MRRRKPMKRGPKLDIKPTNRGFMRADFRDANGDACSIQESSAMRDEGGELLWLGQNSGTHHHVTGDCLARMHVDRPMAATLARVLIHFAKTGRLPRPRQPHPPSPPSQKGEDHE